jgi:hypothetical protein
MIDVTKFVNLFLLFIDGTFNFEMVSLHTTSNTPFVVLEYLHAPCNVMNDGNLHVELFGWLVHETFTLLNILQVHGFQGL